MSCRLVTGGCGFIGSHFLELLLKKYPDDTVVNLDLLTYAGKPENVSHINSSKYHFIKGNIGDQKLVSELFEKYDFDHVYNFAAESHVDNSILGPRVFIETNVNGTLNLLEIAYQFWKKKDSLDRKRFLQVSTDEVYGSLSMEGLFTEKTNLNPSSPYSASKASADMIVRAYYVTYGMPILITRCSNNYGPRQDDEKLIPTMIRKALREEALPVYGDGQNVRDWIYVEDHCEGIESVMSNGKIGEVYHLGAENEIVNLDLVKMILTHLKKPESLISFVKDRLGHDRRYALSVEKVKQDIGWRSSQSFEAGLKTTIDWYIKVYKES